MTDAATPTEARPAEMELARVTAMATAYRRADGSLPRDIVDQMEWAVRMVRKEAIER